MWAKIKAWFGFADLNKDGKVTAEDLEMARAVAEKKIKDANEAINEATEEVKARVEAVKVEARDVVKAAKEVGNQAGDVVKAAKGKARTGRKKK